MKTLLFILIIFQIKLINADMNYICDNIFLGDANSAKNETYLKENNVSAVVNCANGILSNYNEIKFIELDLYDSSSEPLFPKLNVAYMFIKEYPENNILVHCLQGKSRSVSVVIFYLMKEKGWDYDTCIKFIQERRPNANPNSGYVSQLKDYFDKYIKK